MGSIDGFIKEVTAVFPVRGKAIKQRVAELEGEVEKMRKANRLLHDATIVLRNGMGGHEHWDHTMQRGAGCEVCINQRKARDECARLIEAAAEAEGGE